MQKGNPRLRAELQRLTEAPQDADCGWLDVQIQEIDALNKQIPHSIRVCTRLLTRNNRLELLYVRPWDYSEGCE